MTQHKDKLADTTVPAVQTIALGKRYGEVTALGAVDLEIQNNQYYVLLGPSGGGKTTLLRLLGGFVRATSGKVLLHGADVTDVPPERRVTSMVFQSYALFPHMNVGKNVGYGLRLKKLSRAEIAKRTDAMLEMVGLSGYGHRMPHELSGGQQQRVQLARSLVLERDVLLLDEPLAALDAQLRKDMCFELKRIQEEVGITFVHVTHNQEEAMTVADRIALISGGELIEEGTPQEVYEHPQYRFTAEFIGENNVLEGEVIDVSAETVSIDLQHASLAVPRPRHSVSAGQLVALSFRSERTVLAEVDAASPAHDLADWQQLPGTFVKETYFGLTSASLVRLADGSELVARKLTDDAPAPRPGQAVTVRWRTGDARLHRE